MQRIRKVFAKVVAGLLIVSNLAIAAPSMTYAASATSFTTYGGWNEMMYATIKGVKDADVTAVSYSGPVSGSLTGEDFEYLVRDTADGARVDVMGLKPGTYTLKVTTKTGTYTQSGIEVNAQDRSGYAHYNYTDGVGAYNDDGTLKDNAIILYVTDENKNTVTLSYGGVTVSGIGNILNSVGKACGEAGHETECKKVSKGKTYYGKGNTNQGILQLLAQNNIPLVIRMVGAVSESGLYKAGTWAAANAGLIDGLTDYDSNDYGGSVGDNGHMARMKSAKDVTIEGVGTDAAMDGWGIHFMSETSTTAAGLGKSFEVRNITFMNQPEDAIGMEGVQEGSVITAPVERCWIHNNEFYSPSITGPAESDKAEGDGSCDFKRGEYLTVSYNYFEGCHKTNLVGSSDTSLQYNLTYHHNIWKGCKARQPLGRQANMHFYNNQFIGTTDYAMNTRANAYIYSEYNLFFMTKNPMDVRSGAIKSYNDSFSSCIGAMTGTVVTDKSTKVTSGNKYENFDTNASLSYIPSGDYQLQTSVTDAAKVLKAYNGCMPETVKRPENVATSECSLLSYCAPGVTPINISDYPYTAAPGKLSKTVYAFTVGGTVDVTVSFASEALTTTGCLVNETGECFQVGSGTVTGLPAGTYMVMPYNVQSGGNGVNPAAGTFKEMTINSITIKAADPNAHYHHYVSEVTKQATCTEEGVITYTCTATNGTCDKKTYTEVIPKTAHTYGEWKVVKEATETEEGLKSHSCTVCGAEETASIPKKGSTGGTETPEVPTGDSKVHNFTTSGANSSFFVISGNLASNKGTVTYNGLTLTQCLKMESSTSIKFTASSKGTLTLVFGESGKNVKINGKKNASDSNCIVTVDVAAGSVEITKGDTMNLFYMIYTPSGTSETTHTHKYESKITKQATCTEAGVLTYTCTSTTGTCDKKTYTETIPAKGHSFSTEWTVDVEATETTAGSKSHHCTVCDAKTDVTEIPATGPKYDASYYAPVFDAKYYLNKNADLKAAFGDDAQKALVHFVEHGMSEGRQGSAEFNVAAYRARYADLSNAYGDDLVKYYMHYIKAGKAEGRNGAVENTYTVTFKDGNEVVKVQKVKSGENATAPSEIESKTGFKCWDRDFTKVTSDIVVNAVYEEVKYDASYYAPVFDAEYYLNKNADLKKAYGNDAEKALKHFVEHGMSEGRQGSSEFNVAAYRARYADLSNAYGDDLVKYYMHYIKAGKAEGRNGAVENTYTVTFKDGNVVVKVQKVKRGENATAPSEIENKTGFKCWDKDFTKVTSNMIVNAVYEETTYDAEYYAPVFNAEYYLSKYADLKKAYENDTMKALKHFVEHGMQEGRQGTAEFNVYAYKARYADLRSVYGDDLVKYYMHYIRAGKAEGRDGRI